MLNGEFNENLMGRDKTSEVLSDVRCSMCIRSWSPSVDNQTRHKHQTIQARCSQDLQRTHVSRTWYKCSMTLPCPVTETSWSQTRPQAKLKQNSTTNLNMHAQHVIEICTSLITTRMSKHEWNLFSANQIHKMMQPESDFCGCRALTCSAKTCLWHFQPCFFQPFLLWTSGATSATKHQAQHQPSRISSRTSGS